MSADRIEAAVEAAPSLCAADHHDRVVAAVDPDGVDYLSITVVYDTCLTAVQLDTVRTTDGLQMRSVHPEDGDGVRVHFRYYPEEGAQ